MYVAISVTYFVFILYICVWVYWGDGNKFMYVFLIVAVLPFIVCGQIYGPNLLGLALATIQMSLFAIYGMPPTKPAALKPLF